MAEYNSFLSPEIVRQPLAMQCNTNDRRCCPLSNDKVCVCTGEGQSAGGGGGQCNGLIGVCVVAKRGVRCIGV